MTGYEAACRSTYFLKENLTIYEDWVVFFVQFQQIGGDTAQRVLQLSFLCRPFGSVKCFCKLVISVGYTHRFCLLSLSICVGPVPLAHRRKKTSKTPEWWRSMSNEHHENTFPYSFKDDKRAIYTDFKSFNLPTI